MHEQRKALADAVQQFMTVIDTTEFRAKGLLEVARDVEALIDEGDGNPVHLTGRLHDVVGGMLFDSEHPREQLNAALFDLFEAQREQEVRYQRLLRAAKMVHAYGKQATPDVLHEELLEAIQGVEPTVAVAEEDEI